MERSNELSRFVLELCKTTPVKSNFNWFELQEVLEAEVGVEVGRVTKRLLVDLPTLRYSASD